MKLHAECISDEGEDSEGHVASVFEGADRLLRDTGLAGESRLSQALGLPRLTRIGINSTVQHPHFTIIMVRGR